VKKANNGEKVRSEKKKITEMSDDYFSDQEGEQRSLTDEKRESMAHEVGWGKEERRKRRVEEARRERKLGRKK